MPLAQVADLSRMVCQVEIYQTDAPLVKIGQSALLASDAFEKPLRAKVTRIDRLVGYPQLRSTDPLAKVDYRTLPVLLEVEPEDAPTAARWLQLQVEVTISLDQQDDT
jgi:HlyD family secretion protein